MNTAESILVIILSVTLAVFLLLSIAIAIQTLKLVRTLRDVAEHAEKVITSAETAANIFRKTSGPISLIHFVRAVMDTVAEHKQKKREK
jgi:hypothetical protein